MITLVIILHKPLSHSHSRKCPVICPRMVWFRFILTASDFPESVRAFTQPVKTRDISCDVCNAPCTISLNCRMISASAQIMRSSRSLLHSSLHIFHRMNVDLPSKQSVKQSHNKVRHHYNTPFTALIRLLFTQCSLRDWTRPCYSVPNPGSITELISRRVYVHTEYTLAILQDQHAVWKRF